MNDRLKQIAKLSQADVEWLVDQTETIAANLERAVQAAERLQELIPGHNGDDAVDLDQRLDQCRDRDWRDVAREIETERLEAAFGSDE